MNNCRRYRYVQSIEDMKFIYNVAKKHTYITSTDTEYVYRPGKAPLKEATYVINGDRYYKITTMYVKDIVDKKTGETTYVDIKNTDCKKYACTWIFDKTDEMKNALHPSRIAKLSNNVYKPKNIVKADNCEFDKDKNGKIIQSAKPIQGYNEKYNLTEHYVVGYDLNSAYANVLIDKIIDTENPHYYGIVKDNEVGFLQSDISLKLKHKGQYADIIFPLIDSPFKDYVRKYYNQKRYAPKGSKEREEAKSILNITVGLWQNINPYLRAYVVDSCNEFIESFLKKYKDKICLWNTDALYCIEHIPELDALVGTDIGQFKIEYEGLFRQKGLNYQKVDDNTTSYRGVIKKLFDKDYNILTDPLPKGELPYIMDNETYELTRSN